MSDVYNFATYLIKGCKINRKKMAVSLPSLNGDRYLREESTTFGGLLSLIRDYQEGLRKEGIVEGDRVIIIMGASIDLYALILACFCSGVVPVFVDTGMGRQKIIMALEDSKAKAIITSKQLLKLFPVIKPLRSMIRYSFDGYVPFCSSITRLKEQVSIDRDPVILDRKPESHCLITFTSGSTGRPKGADRTHECLINQHLALNECWQFLTSDIGLTCFPVAALHQFACGVTTLLPRADLSHISSYEPQNIVDQISQHSVTVISGAPAFFSRLADFLYAKEYQLNSIRGAILGGSTVPTDLLRKLVKVFPNAEIWVVYGSTESEPISHILAELIIQADSMDGYLVGVPEATCEVAIVNTLKDTPENDTQVREKKVTTGEIGEILVSGKHVLKRYIDNPIATRQTKILRPDGSVWHRTGDFGFLDGQGRIWLVGRDKDLIRYKSDSLPNYPIEKALDAMPHIARSAILNVDDTVALCLEFKEEAVALVDDRIYETCKEIDRNDLTVYKVEHMPVDGRHNSKVDRPKLKTLMSEGKLLCLAGSASHTIPDCYPTLVEEWRSPGRLAALFISVFLVAGVSISVSSGLATVITLLVVNFMIQVPVVFGGVAHMFVVSRDLFPGLKIPLYRDAFGENKTWRGVLAVVLLTVIGTIILLPLEWLQRLFFSTSLLEGVSLIALGIAGGVGYVIGELPNSYLKRRLGANPGEMPKGYEKLFMAMDQIDSALGCAICYFIIGMPLQVCLYFAVTFPITALIVKRYLYLYKLKEMAR